MLAEQTPPTRNRYVDLLRAVSICVVVVGHWLVGTPVVVDGVITSADVLRVLPWTQWMSWVMQVIPVFFVVGEWGGEIAGTVRDSLFTAVSLVTTTGYATADFGAWVSGLQIAAVGLMFVGGMAGSTAGAIKTYRIGVLTSAGRADLRRVIHPRGVFVARLGSEPVPDAIVESVQSFFVFYMMLFMSGTVAMGVIESSLGAGLDMVTSASAVASALGNIGPGLGDVGPSANYLAVPAAGKWLLSSLMIVGRLEIFPVLLLFTRELWRK